MKSRLICIFFCLVLLLAGFLYVSVGAIHELPLQAVAAIKYRLGTGDEIDFTAVTKTNQGTGSSLDADKLDGLNSTAFLQSSSSVSNTFDLGDGQNTNKIYKFNIGGTNLPGVRYNAQTSKVQVSHDGTNWSDMGSGGGGSAPNVENNDTLIATSPSTLDFSSKFSVTESPSGEANINLASGGVSSIEITDGTIANADVATNAAIAESKLALNNPTHSNSNDPIAGEKAALAGTSGTPSGTNKYVTDSDARNTNARTPTAHKDTHKSGGSDALVAGDLLDATAKVAVRKNTGGADVGARRRLNLIEGTNITLTTTDDPTNEEVDVTIASSASGGQTAKKYTSLVLPPASTTSTTYVAIGSGLSVTFTPASATNIILIDVVVCLDAAVGNGALELRVDGTQKFEVYGGIWLPVMSWVEQNLSVASHTIDVRWHSNPSSIALKNSGDGGVSGAYLRIIEMS